MDIKELMQRSKKVRDNYHKLEVQQNGKEWTMEQDALSFLTDAGLVGRLVMDNQKSWPLSEHGKGLDYKIAESIWWLNSIADQAGIDLEAALELFLTEREIHLDK